MKDKDIRWEQRFQNFEKAMAKLLEGVNKNPLLISDLEKEGVIQRFEFTHELAWNVMKDFFEYQGATNINGSRDATREAFKIGLIADGETWMDMIKSRNKTSHTYDEETANEIYNKIVTEYYPVLEEFWNKMKSYLAVKH